MAGGGPNRVPAPRVARYRPVRVPGLPPLVAGAIGYFSYDMVRQIERITAKLRDDIGLDEAVLMFYLGNQGKEVVCQEETSHG